MPQTSETSRAEKVAAAIDFLKDLDNRRFADAFGDAVMANEEDMDDVFGMDSPEPISQRDAMTAFRSDELVQRAWAASNFQIDRAEILIKEKYGPDSTERFRRERVKHFVALVKYEQRYLKTILDGERAKRGRLDNKPNAMKRAQQRLWQLNLAGDVPKGTATQILAEERARDAAAKKALKADLEQRESKLAEARSKPAARQAFKQATHRPARPA